MLAFHNIAYFSVNLHLDLLVASVCSLNPRILLAKNQSILRTKVSQVIEINEIREEESAAPNGALAKSASQWQRRKSVFVAKNLRNWMKSSMNQVCFSFRLLLFPRCIHQEYWEGHRAQKDYYLFFSVRSWMYYGSRQIQDCLPWYWRFKYCSRGNSQHTCRARQLSASLPEKQRRYVGQQREFYLEKNGKGARE